MGFYRGISVFDKENAVTTSNFVIKFVTSFYHADICRLMGFFTFRMAKVIEISSMLNIFSFDEHLKLKGCFHLKLLWIKCLKFSHG